MGALMEAFAEQVTVERQQLRVVKRRDPVLAKVGRFAAKLVARAEQARTAVLAVGGFGFLTAAAWSWHLIAGLAAVGVSLLVLELLSGSDR